MKHVPPVNDNDQSQVSAVLSNEEVIFSSSFKRHNQTWMKCCITQPIPEGNRLLSRFLTWKMAFPGGTSGKEPTCQCRRPKRRSFDTWVGKMPWRRKGMATHSSILVWRIRWTEEPGGLQSTGLQRVGHDEINLACVDSHERYSLISTAFYTEQDSWDVSKGPANTF